MATWNLDSTHSEIEFKVKHMMISTVKGQFENFDVSIEGSSEDLEKAKISAEIKADSINTNSGDRDGHLKGEDFFDVAKYPTISFKSTAVEKSGDDYKVIGDLTIKDVTKSVTFDVEFGGVGKDPWGNQKAGYTVSGKVNRTDFGLNWNAALETGGVLVSDEVKFQADLQFVLS